MRQNEPAASDRLDLDRRPVLAEALLPQRGDIRFGYRDVQADDAEMNSRRVIVSLLQ